MTVDQTFPHIIIDLMPKLNISGLKYTWLDTFFCILGNIHIFWLCSGLFLSISHMWLCARTHTYTKCSSVWSLKNKLDYLLALFQDYNKISSKHNQCSTQSKTKAFFFEQEQFVCGC